MIDEEEITMAVKIPFDEERVKQKEVAEKEQKKETSEWKLIL